MNARAESPRQRHSAGIQLVLNFLQSLPPYRWTQARLVRWGFTGRTAVIAVPFLWLLLFFLIPFIIVLRIAFSETRNALPPYAPLYELVYRGELKGWLLNVQLYLESFGALFTKSIYWTAYLNSLRIAVVSTLICLLVGYPIAYAIARARSTTRMILLMMVILPFWTSFLLRVYAWIGLLKNNGVINNFLMWTGIIDQPIVMLQTDFAIYVGIVYSYLPFMILPLYSNLEKMDLTLLEAAADLGSRPFNAFMKITLPLSMPGIVAGSMLVFIPVVGEFVIPELLGPADTLMIGKLLWREFFTARNWPGASAVAIALVLLLVIPIVFLQRAQSAEARGGKR
jgi:putrescine transport system permease protein